MQLDMCALPSTLSPSEAGEGKQSMGGLFPEEKGTIVYPVIVYPADKLISTILLLG